MEEVKYLKFRSYMHIYCPFCHQSLNVHKKGTEDYLLFKAGYDDKEFDLKLSPYLDVFEVKSSIPLKEGTVLSYIKCPHCGHNLLKEGVKCKECGSPTAEVIVSAFSKLIPFYICLKYGCPWHGLSKADERRIKLKVPRQDMPEQDRVLRVRNFDEVPYGYTKELATLEASRCLECKDPKCVEGCPVEIDIPGFIKLIKEEKFVEAARKIKEKNALPSICGRVCPQEDQCEAKCVLGIKDRPVAIGNLERYVADYERKMDMVTIPTITVKNNKKVAVVGSGPSGLTIAADLVKLGYSVTIFEALHKPGGVLVYGIPEFRLPKAIVGAEIDYLQKLGVKVECNKLIGQIYTIDELLEHFDAVYISVGAGLPRFMKIPGENLCNVFSANEYLTRINLMKAYKFPEYDTPLPLGKNVAVIGGGNVTMDCARTALRTGANKVTVVYRRSRKEMPARDEEIRHAEEEGIHFKLLTNPVRYIGNDQNWVTGMECVQMKLGELDASGRRRPIPIKDSNFILDCDMVVVAIGTGPNPTIFSSTPDLERNKWGYIKINEKTGETSKEFVYAGGDIVTGSATVIKAMGAARISARAIHKKLMK